MIKFIYNKKVHKVPSTVNTFDLLLTTIKEVYPQLKQTQAYIWVIINPGINKTFKKHNLESQDSLQQVKDQKSFEEVRAFYDHQKWPTIKFLVSDNTNIDSILKDSWCLLGQSMLIVDKKSVDASVSHHPQQMDQTQQCRPNVQPQSIQVQVQQRDSSQNTQKIEQVDQKIQKSDESNNEDLQNLIIRLIDERLRYHGLLKNDYTILQFQNEITARAGEHLQFPIKIRNTQAVPWNGAIITCEELKFKTALGAVQSMQEITIQVKVEAPKVFGGMKCNFQIFAVDNQQKQIKIGDPIVLNLNVLNQVYQKGSLQEKVEELHVLFPQKTKEELTKFIQNKGANKQVEELVELLFLN